MNVNKEYDVAVIDEIQMIADPARGHAWTRALLGLRAREIHVCGGLEALDVRWYYCTNIHMYQSYISSSVCMCIVVIYV